MALRRPVASVLLHPYLLVALAVLIANDHWWKQRWPGLVTGKLSDFAGPVVVAFTIAAVTGRRHLAVTATALGFAALKLSPAVAVLAAPLLGGVTRTDPTDLVGLVALLPARLFLARARLDPRQESSPTGRLDPPRESSPTGRLDQLGSAASSRPIDPPRSPVATVGARAKAAALVVIAPIMVFSITATSCEESSAALVGLFDVESGVVAQVGDNLDAPVAYYLSGDGGRSWAEVDLEDIPGAGGGLDPDAVRATVLIQETEVCLDDGRCFRSIEGSRIEVRDDADWVTSFRFTDEQVERMQARADGCSGADRTDQFYASLVVTDADGPVGEATGQTVVATMGPQGVLRLDRSTGEWERIAVGTYEPISYFGPRWLLQLVFSPFAALLATPLLLLINRRRNVSGARRAVAVMVNVAGSLVVFALAIFVLFFSLGSADYAWTGLLALAFSILVFVVAVAVVLPPGSATPAPPPAPAPPPSRHRPPHR